MRSSEILWRQVQRIEEASLLRSTSDAELATRFAESADRTAFEELFRRTGPPIWGVCVRGLGMTPDAEDAFQAVFLLLVQNINKVRHRANVAGWLYGTARKVVARSTRQRARRNAREKSNQQYREPDCEASEPRDWEPLLERALDRIPEKYRDVLVLCELQQRSRSEVAKFLNLSENTLSSRLARAKEMLRAKLSPTSLGLPVGLVSMLTVPSVLCASTIQRCCRVFANSGEMDPIVPLGIVSLIRGGATTVIGWKYLIGCSALLLAGFGVVGSIEPAQQVEPKPEKKAELQVPKTTAEPADAKHSGEKKPSKLELLRIEKAQAAADWLDGLLERYRLGREELHTLRLAAVASFRAKWDLCKTNGEREAVLTEQRKFFVTLKEMVLVQSAEGIVKSQAVSEVKVYLIDAEIELELFKENSKGASPPSK